MMMMRPRDWDSLRTELGERAGAPVLANEPMARHTSFRTGGLVRAFVAPADRQAFVETLRWLRGEGIPVTVLGAGTNVLWADAPYAGVVLHGEAALGTLAFDEGGEVQAGGGVRLSRILSEAQDRELGGFSFLYGIPGTVGGAVRMNAGTSLGSMASVLRAAEILDVDGAVAWRAGTDLDLSYRHSNLAEGDVVLAARMVSTGPLGAEEKADLTAMKTRRKATQPLQNPSCGSVFRNPEGRAAGRLIDEAGLRGRRAGSAEVSERHGNFIIHDGTSTSREIRTLIREVQAEVYRVHGIWLEPEVHFLGPWPEEGAL